MQPGDVTETFADVDDLMRDVGFRPETPIEDGHRATLSRGIAITTGFETRMNRRIIPLIMCGGAGTRLWPASREVHPKQFLPLFGRALDVSGYDVAGVGSSAVRTSDRDHQYRLSLHGAGATGRDRARGRFLLEPMRRDSGPAIAAGAAFAQSRDGEAIVLALAADHVVARHRCLCRGLPPGSRRRGSRAHRDLRRAPERAGHRIRLYQSGRSDFRRGSQRGEVCREAGSRDGCRLCQGGLSLEQRQLHVSRLAFCSTNIATSMPASVQAVTDSVTKAGRDLGFVTLDPEPSNRRRRSRSITP